MTIWRRLAPLLLGLVLGSLHVATAAAVAGGPALSTTSHLSSYSYDGMPRSSLRADAPSPATGPAAATAGRPAPSLVAEGTPPAATVFAAKAGTSAYETALAGGRHAGFLANYAGKSTPLEIERGIASIERQIAQHESWIENPYS